jgi:hypothetical protein
VIRSKKPVESEFFGKLSNSELLAIGRALLGLNEDTKFHTPRLSVVLNR